MTGEQIGNVDLVKQLNGAVVYRLIDQKGPISRIQIAEMSRLAPASVTKITRQLLERGLIKEVAQQASTGGRRAISLTIESSAFQSVAVKIGRDKIELALLDLSGNVLGVHSEPFDYKDEDGLLIGLKKYLHLFLAQYEAAMTELIAIAIVLPGLVNADHGIVEYMPNIFVKKLTLAQHIKNEFDVECFIGNDTRGQALAEHYFGASKNYHDSILVSVHNGTGAGIIVNGKVFLGYNRNVGEIGHIQIDPLGTQCQCGNFGCLETLVSNPAIIKQFKSLIASGQQSTLSDKKNVDIHDICQAAISGDELSQQVLLRVGQYLGRALAITVNLFNPQQIIISGAITEAKDIIFPTIQRYIENQTLTTFHQNLPIVEAELTHIPTIGAFSLVKRALINGTLLQQLLDE